MTTEEIIKIAYQLGQAIAHSSQISEVKKTQQDLYQDQTAHELIMSYQEAKNRLENKTNRGLPLTAEEEQNISTLEEQINDNNLIKEFIIAQERFNHLMQSVYFAMNKTIAGEDCSSGCNVCPGNCTA